MKRPRKLKFLDYLEGIRVVLYLCSPLILVVLLKYLIRMMGWE